MDNKKNAFPLLENNHKIYRILSIEENYLEYLLNEKFDIGICLDADKFSATILNIAKCKEKFGFVTDEFGQIIPANNFAVEWFEVGVDEKLKRTNRKTYFEHIYKICNLKGHYFKPQYYLKTLQV